MTAKKAKGKTKKTAAATTDAVSLTINREAMVDARSASGKKSLHTGDDTAVALEGLTVPGIQGVAEELIGETFDYSHLNIGMQRMNLGNRIRAFVNASGDDIKEGARLKTLNKLAKAVRKTEKAATAA